MRAHANEEVQGVNIILPITADFVLLETNVCKTYTDQVESCGSAAPRQEPVRDCVDSQV